MRKIIFSSILILALLVAIVGSVGAITFGVPDGNTHPYVGTLLFVQNGVGYFSCSGTLLSPTVMLTAGHCTEEAGNTNDETWVRFDENALDGLADAQNLNQWLRQDWIRARTVIPHPQYNDFNEFPNTYDVGLVILSHPVYLDTYGQLPELGLLEQVATNEMPNSFTAVGYGVQGVINPFEQDDFARYRTTVRLVEISSTYTGPGQSAKFTNNPGGGTGGTCFGDSGGPIFYQDTSVVTAVVSFGVTPCIGVDYQFRIDTHAAQDFIRQYVP